MASTENDRWVARVAVIGLLTFAVLMLYAGIARADGILQAHESSVTDVGPCLSGSHWVLTGAAGVTSATLTVDGVDYTMSPNGAGHEWDADAGATTDQTVAFVTYTGTLTDGSLLNLSHCEDVSVSPTPTPTPTDTPSPSTSPSETPPPTSSTPPPSSTTTSTPPPTHTHTSPPGSPAKKPSPKPTKTAFTGLGSAGDIAAGLAVLLLVVGSLAVLRSRTKG